MLHLLLPVVATYGYMNLPKDQLSRIPESVVYGVSVVHNLGLFLFSGYHFMHFVSVLSSYGVIAGRGFYFVTPGLDSLVWSFYLSKYYEYMDTAILYAKGKEPCFLQKCHHMGATFIWHLGYL